jgi:exonuclease SbcD
MRVLHTSDWHLAQTLKQVQRIDDQLQRVEEVLTICDEREVDLLLVAGDVVDETSPTKMPRLINQLGALLKPRLERGLTAVFLAGNHDRAWIFPLLQGVGELFAGTEEAARLHFSSIPELRTVRSGHGERLRIMLLPYPWPWTYSLEAVQGATAAERRRQIAVAVQDVVERLTGEAKAGEKMPTIVAAHMLVTGVEVKHRELTEAEDVPVPQVSLPNYPYVALGHVHQAQAIGGRPHWRYSGSLERIDFGEAGEDKSVVLVEVGKTDLEAEPEVIPVNATQLVAIEWRPGDSIEEKCSVVPEGAIAKLTIYLERGMTAQQVQSQARRLIGPRLLFPPAIEWLGTGGARAEGAAALERLDWQEAVRLFVAMQVADDDRLRHHILNAIEQLIAEEALT